MAEDRFCGLRMMIIHHEMLKVNKDNFIQNVITRFGKSGRNLQFLFTD